MYFHFNKQVTNTMVFELDCKLQLPHIYMHMSQSFGLQEYQLILKEINPEYSLEELMLKLKLQCFGHLWQLIGKALIWDRLKEKEKRVVEDEMVRQHHELNGHELEQTLGIKEDRGAWLAAVNGMAKSET